MHWVQLSAFLFSSFYFFPLEEPIYTNMQINFLAGKIFFVFTFLLSANAAAQTIKIKTNNMEWPSPKPRPIAVEEQFKNCDAVILDERTEIKVLNEKEFAFNNSDFTLRITKNYRIKFLTQKGIDKYKTIWLPENFNDASNYSDTLFANRHTLHRPKVSIAAIETFNARIIRADGKVAQSVIEQVFEKETFYMHKRGTGAYSKELEHFIDPSGLAQTETFAPVLRSEFSAKASLNRLLNPINTDLYAFGFEIKNIKPGDEVEVYMTYMVYDKSRAIFLNGNLPKQNYQLDFSYDNKDVYVLNFFNDALPENQTEKTIVGIKRNFLWKRKNLVAIANEPGSRAHESLPYFSYYKHEQNYGILKPNGDYEQLLPYSWEAVYLQYVNYVDKGFKRSFSSDGKLAKRFFSRPDKNTVTLNNFFDSVTKNIPDTSLFKRFDAVHKAVVNNFEYDDDRFAFNDNVENNENIGKYIKNYTLRNMSRQRFYNEMALRLRNDFYLALLCDKRIEKIDFKNYSPINHWRYYFVVVDKSNPFYFYPKHHRFGLYANEMPFYLEDCSTFLIPQAEPDSNTWRQNIHATFYAIRTPYSSLLDNMRTSNVLVNVNTQSFTATFEAKVELKGQFSTMQRGCYMYHYSDATVNPEYNKRICDLPYPVTVDSIVFDSQLEEFPFTSNMHIKYSTKNFIKPLADGGYQLNIAGLCQHIIYHDLDTTNRQLDFYSDFVSQDGFKYFIKFDKPITVVNAADFNKEEKNSFGALKINIVNAQPDVVMIEAKLVVSAEKTEAKNIGDVARIFYAIEKLNNGALLVK